MRMFGRIVAEASSRATATLILMSTYRDLRSSLDVSAYD